MKRKKAYADLKPQYDFKKEGWKSEKIPKELLPFVLCSLPGLSLTAFQVQPTKAPIESGDVSKRARKGRKRANKSLADDSKSVAIPQEQDQQTTEESLAVQREAIILKRQEMKLKVFALDERASDRKLQDMESLMKLYRETGRESSDEFKQVSTMYANHLLARIQKESRSVQDVIDLRSDDCLSSFNNSGRKLLKFESPNVSSSSSL